MSDGGVASDWEEQEIDRAFDLANMVFGAALGAYVGVIIATTNIQVIKVWWLALALFGLTLVLNAVRAGAHVLRGTHSGTVEWLLVSIAGGLVTAGGGLARSGFRMDIALALATGWVATLVLLLGSYVARKLTRP